VLSITVQAGKPVLIAEDMPDFNANRIVDRLLGPER
jgi:hypothetical protein